MQFIDKASVSIGQYADYYAEWYGLPDGTMLDLSNPEGRMYRRIGSGEVEEISLNDSVVLSSPADI